MVFAGFLLGFLGSFHCVGMCGPIALSLPLCGNTFGERLLSGLLYNFGRAFMYGVLGILFGFIGQGFFMLGFQRWISITIGLIMIVSVISPLAFKKIRFRYFDLFTDFVRTKLQHLFQKRSYKGLFLIGMLNSLLPCGLVYIAMVGAVATGNVLLGGLYLVLFGLGTLPMMLMISMVGNAISLGIRKKINKVIPYLVVLMGVLFIFRGLCLGIPYLSPSKEHLENAIQTTPADTCTKNLHNSGDCCHSK